MSPSLGSTLAVLFSTSSAVSLHRDPRGAGGSHVPSRARTLRASFLARA
jgi:hypothetical protein